MVIRTRTARPLSVLILLVPTLLFCAAGYAVTTDTPTPTATGTPTPTTTQTGTPTPTGCPQVATAVVAVSSTTVLVGDTVTVNLSTNSNGGCHYAGIAQASVSQQGGTGVFTPATQFNLYGGGPFTFTAASPGTINFHVGVYGEYAGGYLPTDGNWSYAWIYGDSASVTVVTPTPTATETPTPAATETPTPGYLTPTSTQTPTPTPNGATSTPIITITQTPTPTPTVNCATSAATVTVTTSSTPVVVGDPITVYVSTQQTIGCLWQLSGGTSVTQQGGESVFSPASQSIYLETTSNPLTNEPFTFTAQNAGSITFKVSVSGVTELYTPEFGWHWQGILLYGYSNAVTVVTPSPTPDGTTSTPTSTQTSTPTPTAGTPTPSHVSPTPTLTATQTPTVTPSWTPTPTGAGPTATPTPTPTKKPMATATPSPTLAPVLTSFSKAKGDLLGYSAAFIGDINNDNYGDYIVGAHLHDVVVGSTTLKDAGSAYVISGKTGQILFTFNGSSKTEYFGFAVAAAGNVNNDDVPDVAVGAYLADKINPDSTILADAGTVKVFSGANGNLLYQLWGNSTREYFGYSVAGIHDANGDGIDDIAVGAPLADNTLLDVGSVRIFTGNTGTLYRTYYGDAAGDSLGRSLAYAGDINKDNYGDVIAGAPLADKNALTDSGYVRVYSPFNNSVLTTLTGALAGDNFGSSVNVSGDVNNDGTDDVIVGAFKADLTIPALIADAGSATIYSGANWSVIHQFTGTFSRDYFGSSVTTVGDIDGDSYDDVAIGAYGFDAPITNSTKKNADAGKVTVYSGNDYAALFALVSNAKGDYLGWFVSGGDINNDEQFELLVTAPRDDITVNGATIKDIGSVNIISTVDISGTLTLETTATPTPAPTSPGYYSGNYSGFYSGGTTGIIVTNVTVSSIQTTGATTPTPVGGFIITGGFTSYYPSPIAIGTPTPAPTGVVIIVRSGGLILTPTPTP